MKQVYRKIDSAVLEAVKALYLDCDKITIEDSKINGEEVPWHVFFAICERIKYNANLHGERSAPGTKSHVMLEVEGKPRNFDVQVTPNGGLSLTLQR